MAFTCLLIIALVYFAIMPAIKGVKEIRAEMINQRIELDGKIKQEKNITGLNESIKKIEPQLQQLDKIFINQNRELEFITILESIEKKNFVEQKLNIGAFDANSANAIKIVPINLAVSGEYANVFAYLNDLETLPYYVNINKINIDNSGAKTAAEENSRTIITLSITADTYWK